MTAGAFPLTSFQCMYARELVGWSIIDLARKAKVDSAMLSRFEGNRATFSPDKLTAIRFALEEAGVEFTERTARMRSSPP